MKSIERVKLTTQYAIRSTQYTNQNGTLQPIDLSAAWNTRRSRCIPFLCMHAPGSQGRRPRTAQPTSAAAIQPTSCVRRTGRHILEVHCMRYT